MRAGLMRKRITIQQRATTVDSYGEQSSTWTDVKTVWASIDPATGSELYAAQSIRAEMTHAVKIRYLSGVTAKMRVKYGSRYFNVTAVRNVDERNREMQLMCVEGLADG